MGSLMWDDIVQMEDIRNFIRGNESTAMLYVRDREEPTYKTVRKICKDVFPTTEDNDYSINKALVKLFDSLRHMESNDYNKVVNTFKKYEVAGTSGGVKGKRTYGYDVSRVDGRLIRRGRPN